ncbi:MAG: phosphoglucosamine mutase, partial [Erysipelotrichia bacterium]|nr:phosphoglucosamine mutase [Erysipelotrichia bacterium]
NKEIGYVIDAKHLLDKYLDFLVSNAGDLSSLRIVVDCAHGSASVLARKLFTDRLKIDATYLNETFNGTDINYLCGSTHLEQITNETKNGNYDLGLAFDGDADRLILISRDGNVIDGDKVLYLCALNFKKHHDLKDDTIVLTIMSNLGLKKALAKEGIFFEEVDVGDKYVQAKLKEKDLMLGGEQSGHIIFYRDLNTGDGLLTALKVMNVVAKENKTLDQLVDKLTILPQVLKNEKVSNKVAVMESKELKVLIEEIERELGEEGRILVRPSGTEQLIRVMVEAKTKELCEYYVDKTIALVKDLSF